MPPSNSPQPTPPEPRPNALDSQKPDLRDPAEDAPASDAPASDAPGIRSFLALELSAEVRAKIAEVLERLRKGIEFTGAHPAWVRAENIHLTLHFLGNVTPQNLDALKPRIDSLARRFAAPRIEVRGRGVFPNERAPRILWIGIPKADASLAEFREALAPLIQRIGVRPDAKPFHPHLTLARIKSMRGVRGMMSVVGSHERFDAGACRPAEAVLFRSDLRPEGAIYTPMHRSPFGAR